MTGQTMLTMCSKIIKRQDLDRTLLLFYINNLRKTSLRSAYLFPNVQTKTIGYDTEGCISITANKIKAVKSITYVSVDGTRTVLYKITGYDSNYVVANLTSANVPKAYFEIGDTIKIYPYHENGTLEVTAEFYRSDVTDSTDALDSITDDLAESLVYLASAEYFDMLDEIQKGSFWRQKGSVMLAEYMRHLKIRQSDNINLLDRDPLGNLNGVSTVTTSTFTDETAIDEVDGGDASSTYEPSTTYDGGDASGN